MGKLSFRYMIKPELARIHAFKYMANQSTEYGFAYQRYAALSDASILNSPVGITKIAAGLSNLRQLFVTPLMYANTDIKEDFSDSPHDFKIREDRMDKSGLKPRYKDPVFESSLKRAYRDFHMKIQDNTIMITNGENTGNDFPIIFIPSNITTINYYEEVFSDREPNHMKILKDNNTKKIVGGNDDITVRYWDFSVIFKEEPDMKILKDILTIPETNDFKILKDISAWTGDPTGNIIYQILGNKKTHNPLLNEIFFAWRETPNKVMLSITENVSKEILAGKYEQWFAKINKTVNWLENIYTTKKQIIANRIIMKICSKGLNIIDKNYDIPMWRIFKDDSKIPYLNIFPQLMMYQGNKKSYDMNEIFYSVKPEGKTGYFFNIDTFGIQETKYSLVMKTLSGKDYGKSMNVPYYAPSGRKWNLDGFIPDTVNSGIKDGLNAYQSYYKISGFRYNKESDLLSNEAYGQKDSKESYIARYEIRGKQVRKNSKGYSDGVQFFKDRMMLMDLQSHSFGYKAPKDLWNLKEDYFTPFEKTSKDFRILKDYFGQKSSHNIDIWDIKIPFESFDKIPNDMYLKLADYWAYKSKKDMEILKDNQNALKVPKDIELYKLMLSIDDLRHRNEIDKPKPEPDNPEEPDKPEEPPKEPDKFGGISIELTDAMKDPLFAAKKVYNLQMENIIIPISRINYHSIVNTNLLVAQGLKEANELIKSDMWASVVAKPTQIDYEEVFMDKDAFHVMTDVQNEWLIKQKLKTSIMNHITSGSKTYKQSNTFRNTWISKSFVNIYIGFPESAAKQYKKAFESINASWASRTSKNVYSFTFEWMDKLPVLGYYSYGLWADKPLIDSEGISNFETADKISNNGVVDCNSIITKNPNIKIWLEDILFTDRNSKDFSIYKQVGEWVQRTRSKMNIRPEDFGNWAWVYETPDPMEHAYGIDELLLPEEDVRYENFEELIFDKETLKPRNPVKVIDDTTFIAKFPIRHPSKGYYDDIAKNYDASAIKWENYYGIKTEVMRTCFLKYYRIWETKMFEFSTMTMQQAVNQMLEYMYVWMIDYFPLEELEQAFRVLRLIRWYGESAIIQNSQYIISYEYDILESKLTTGKCMVPNNLDDNDTMIIDKNLGIIKNNPAYIGNGKAYVEFYIDNKRNTSFTFSLSNTVGSVNIYINDVLIDQKSFSALNLTYELPFTGDTNVIRIEKPANHNLNATFYIGNIKIPDCSFKDLSIEFDPKLRAGNKPIDVVAKKMVKFAQLHENSSEAYDMIYKKNLGVSEVYNMLLEYWKIHHENKSKGKRLTIKKS